MIGLYRPGHSPLHRLGAGSKLLALFIFALAVSVPPPSIALFSGAAAVMIGLYLLGGFGPAEIWRQIISARVIITILLVSQVLFLDPAQAWANVSRVTIVILTAALLTLTTRTTEILDALVRVLRPLRVFGVDPERVGLAFSLTIRTIPVIAGFSTQLRDAQRARGGRWSIRALVLPLMVLSLRQSDELADALIARGAGDDPGEDAAEDAAQG
ncbi:energy-coupling factor transporter transmembrane component T family protein [Mycetocola spongiae]|uniref:energy-coupling factor transporter transmembrane component T family protein n=1 Tax=Mycetocola spongiae TaxID=2859226 RepID=UPI001CF11416|nr:energy-coupling factor transporter transmembrane protein EcfT [Mycetocola spongiae]UCR88503.1 energy-coupling factor transporter transmembrane protein EcfT [Mycetocola spongiae]